MAEKNRFWRLGGSSVSTRCNSSLKPKSSKRSASSSTNICTWLSRSALCSTRSSRRPGVATTTSAPPRRAIICGLMDTPPNTMAILGGCGRCWARLRSTSPTWAASSRVGTKTSARVRRGVLPDAMLSWCSRGKPKAAVLPDPVWARPWMSAPCKAAGMVLLWMGVGLCRPMSVAARTRAGCRPSAENGMEVPV